MKPIIAIDPGASGAIAYSTPEGLVLVEDMPKTEGDVVERLRDLFCAGGTSAVLEEVGGWGMPGPRGFTFGRGFGFLLGVLQTLGASVILVRPQKWQKALSLGSVKDSGGKTAWKRKLLAEAQRRFPALDVTLHNADALLILEYAKTLA